MPLPFDVAILGSGFAGSLLGLLLRKRGLSVLVIDRQKHPRFAIGESSTPAADFILESLCDEYDLPELKPLCRYGSWCRSQPSISRGLKRGFSYFHHRLGEPFAPGPNHERELLVAASANDEVGDTHWYRADVDAFIAQLFVKAGGQLWEETSVESIEAGSLSSLADPHQICPLSPTIDAAFETNSAVGERAGVRGLEREAWPPHPNPLPRNVSTCGANVARGGEGAENHQLANSPIPEGPIWGLECQRQGVTTRVEARFLVDGTGGDSALVKTLGLTSEVGRLSTHSRSLFGHFHGVHHWGDLLDQSGIDRTDHPYPCDQAALHHIIDGGWMWMLRFDNGITSVGWSLDPRRHPLPANLSPEEEWQLLLSRYPSIADQLRDARPARPFTTEIPLARTGRMQRLVSQAAGTNWALLPHTAGFIDPFYSTGIAQSLLGVESLAAILSQSGSLADRTAELERYSCRLKQEVTLVDQFVSLACQTMGHDPRLLHAASMLYFAAATTFEARRKAGIRGEFLLADDEEFRQVVSRLHSTCPQGSESVDDWVRSVQDLTQPWNTVGLFEPLRPNMYWHTAAPKE